MNLQKEVKKIGEIETSEIIKLETRDKTYDSILLIIIVAILWRILPLYLAVPSMVFLIILLIVVHSIIGGPILGFKYRAQLRRLKETDGDLINFE